MPPGTGLRTVLDRACAAQGLRPEIALQASAADAVAALAERGLGAAVLGDSMAAHYDGLTARPVEDADAPARLCLLWRTSHGPAVREALAHCRRAFRRGGTDTA
ncbi:hypothetical protein EAO77_00090 [Streptomyces sp. t39]|nr:hypothetical protein EAO77_00090 [Streptomyces sp. t39]